MKYSVATLGLALGLCLGLVRCGIPEELSGDNSAPPDVGAGVAQYLESKLDHRVGGGESDDLATEALRVSGGEFYPPDLGEDFPHFGDRCWGTLVTEVKHHGQHRSDSQPQQAVRPGDVIQFCGEVRLGEIELPDHFTAIVAQTDEGEEGSAARPTALFVQNFVGERTVQRVDFEMDQFTGGTMRIFRPVVRTDANNVWKFTVLNNSAAPLSYDLLVDIETLDSVTVAPANQTGSLRVHRIETNGTVPALLAEPASLYLQNGECYEITDAPLEIHLLAP